MSWRIPTGHGVLAALRTWLVFVLALGALAGCGGGGAPPPTPEEAEEVMVRVSGAEGIAYTGDYSSLESPPEDVNATLEGSPMEYTVQVTDGVSDGVIAFFRKTEAGPGELKAEILADGELVVESTTYAEFGSIALEWLPEAELLEEPLPEEDLLGPPDGAPPEEDLPKEAQPK